MKLSNNMLNNINGLMAGGGCPTSDHLGECAVIFEGSPGRYQAMLYIFDGAFNDSTQVADWFHDLGAVDVSVSQTLHSDANGDRNGKTVDGGQEWTVEFTLKGEHPHAEEQGKYADVLLPFLKLMETELHANTGKGDRPGWLAMDRKTALLEIFYHLGKLQKALKNGSNDGIREHAADTANMCMMLVDICGLLTGSDPTAAETNWHTKAIAEGIADAVAGNLSSLEDVKAKRCPSTTQPAAGFNLIGIAEQLGELAGWWNACSGCHETEEGQPVGTYSYSPALGCSLGSGCSECGGLGAVWHRAEEWLPTEEEEEELDRGCPSPEERTVNIPGCEQHEGLYSLRVTMPWTCLHCGGPRGEPYDSTSYDGSRHLSVHRWENPCGHLETYGEVRATLTGLPLGRPSEAEEAQP